MTNRLTIRWLAYAAAIIVAGCGDSGGDNDDNDAATGLDASATIDSAATVDAPPTSVTARFLNDGTPEAGINILFSAADGTVIVHKMTDAAGEASHDVPAGSMVTALVDEAGSREAWTYVGVKPGDVVLFGSPAAFNSSDKTLAVTMPPAQTGATEYRVTIGCNDDTGSPGAVVTLNVFSEAECVGSDGNVDVLVLATDETGVPVGHVSRKGVSVAAAATTLDLSGEAWDTNFDAVAFNMTNAPAAATDFGLEFAVTVDVNDFELFEEEDAIEVAGNTTGTTVPRGFSSEHLLVARVFVGAGLDNAYVRRAAPTATININWTNDLLPHLTAATISTANAAQPSVTWTATGDVSISDVGFVQMSWTTAAEDSTWQILIPGDASSATLPVMPAALAGFAPTAASTHNGPTVGFLEGDVFTGYDQFRTQAGLPFFTSFDPVPRGTLGHVRFTAVSPDED